MDATREIAVEVLGQKLRFKAFKRSIPALDKVLGELNEDLYRLQHLSQEPGDEALLALDIGASVGVVSVLMCKLWANSRVVAVEPAPANFRYLLWNLRVNNATGCVWPINVAVGSSPSAAQSFFYSPTYPTWSQACTADCPSSASEDTWRGGWTDWQVHFEAEVVTVAELLAALGLGQHIHLLKVDCEGCEWGIFAPHLWQRLAHRVRNVRSELHHWALPGYEEERPSPPDSLKLEAQVQQLLCRHKLERENTLCSTS